MITLSRARHQIPGLERKRYWNSGLAQKDLGIFSVSVCLETFRPLGGGYGIAFKKDLDKNMYFFFFKKCLTQGWSSKQYNVNNPIVLKLKMVLLEYAKF